MKINQALSLIGIVAIIVSALASSPGCATIVPPTGGPRDTLPPVLLKVTPSDSSKNFAAKKIVFEFNEYIQLDNIQQRLLVSPTPKINPVILSKLRTITVEIKDTLEENTTYSIDFGNAVKDLNEGNLLRNFSYLFTTGNTLDSMTLSGEVIVAETGKRDSTLIAMLYQQLDDSAVIKERPRYIAKLDKEGKFRFSNLAPGTYAIYALKDEGARRYLSKDQLFAFADSAIQSESLRDDIVLYAYAEKPQPDTSKRGRPGARAGVTDQPLKYQTNLAGGQLQLKTDLSLSFDEPLRVFDPSKLIFLNDSFEVISNYTLQKDTGEKKITLVHPWKEDAQYHLVLDTAFAEDTLGRRIAKTDTLHFRTKKQSDYGTVRLRFSKLQLDRNPVLQLVQSDQVKLSHPFTNAQFHSTLVEPGEYELRILYDENKNGEWDAGEFFGKHLQPEKVQPIPAKLNVRANWDNEMNIEL